MVADIDVNHAMTHMLWCTSMSAAVDIDHQATDICFIHCKNCSVSVNYNCCHSAATEMRRHYYTIRQTSLKRTLHENVTHELNETNFIYIVKDPIRAKKNKTTAYISSHAEAEALVMKSVTVAAKLKRSSQKSSS